MLAALHTSHPLHLKPQTHIQALKSHSEQSSTEVTELQREVTRLDKLVYGRKGAGIGTVKVSLAKNTMSFSPLAISNPVPIPNPEPKTLDPYQTLNPYQTLTRP